MTDTPKGHKRGKRGPNVWALISAAERAGKRVKSITITFEEPGSGADEASGSQSVTPLEEWRKKKGRGQS